MNLTELTKLRKVISFKVSLSFLWEIVLCLSSFFGYHLRMNFPTNLPLTPREFAFLKEVSVGLMARKIPIKHRDRLIEVGLIEQKIGGLMLTSAGKMRLALNT